MLSAAPVTFAASEPGPPDSAGARKGDAPKPNYQTAVPRANGGVPADNLSDEGLVEVKHPRGGYSKNLQGRFQEYYVVTLAADGTATHACVNEAGLAEQLARPAAPAPSPQGAER